MNRLKSRWLLIPVAVFALAAVAVGAFAVGAGESFADGGARDGFAARVASILGLDEAAVSDAMSQAKRELRAEKTQDALDDKVSDGDITQAQADEYLAWLDAAPDWASGHGRGGRHFAKRANSDRLQDALDRKVSSGDITQTQADEYLAWAESAPDWMEDAMSRARQAKLDRLQDALDAKVSDGVITQAQADRYLARAESGRGFRGKWGRFGHKRGWRF